MKKLIVGCLIGAMVCVPCTIVSAENTNQDTETSIGSENTEIINNKNNTQGSEENSENNEKLNNTQGRDESSENNEKLNNTQENPENDEKSNNTQEQYSLYEEIEKNNKSNIELTDEEKIKQYWNEYREKSLDAEDYRMGYGIDRKTFPRYMKVGDEGQIVQREKLDKLGVQDGEEKYVLGKKAPLKYIFTYKVRKDEGDNIIEIKPDGSWKALKPGKADIIVADPVRNEEILRFIKELESRGEKMTDYYSAGENIPGYAHMAIARYALYKVNIFPADHKDPNIWPEDKVQPKENDNKNQNNNDVKEQNNDKAIVTEVKYESAKTKSQETIKVNPKTGDSSSVQTNLIIGFISFVCGFASLLYKKIK